MNVSPVNDAPVLVAPLNDLTVVEDSGSQTIDLSSVFADIDSSLTFSVGSDNPGLAGVSISGTNLVLTPAANQFGSATIAVTASDGEFQLSDAFTLTITPVNDTPIVATILADLTLQANASDGTLDLSTAFTDVDDPSLTFSANSSNENLVLATVDGDFLVLSLEQDQTGTLSLRPTPRV